MDAQPKRYVDPVIEYYKQFVDREALRENFKLTVEQRIHKHEAMLKLEEARRSSTAQCCSGNAHPLIKI